MQRILLWAASALALLAGAGFARGGEATPMPRSDIVALVTATLQRWQENDAKGFVGAFADEAVWAFPGGTLTKDKFAAAFADLEARKRDIKIYVGDFVIQGNEFAVQYQFAATDKKTGRRWAVGTGVRGRVAGGKIAVLKEYWDEHIPVFQLAGQLPLDEGKPFPAPASVIMTGERVN